MGAVVGSVRFQLTVLLLEDDLGLVLHLVVQHLLDLLHLLRGRVLAEEELAGAALLHDLGPREAGELAEAIRAVDDGVGVGDLSVAQDKVAVCMEAEEGGER